MTLNNEEFTDLKFQTLPTNISHPHKKHNIEVVVDRLVIKEGIRSRLYSSIETAAGTAPRRKRSARFFALHALG